MASWTVLEDGQSFIILQISSGSWKNAITGDKEKGMVSSEKWRLKGGYQGKKGQKQQTEPPPKKQQQTKARIACVYLIKQANF